MSQALIAKFGDPGRTPGKPNADWMRQNVVTVTLPWPMVCAYTGKAVTKVRFHRLGAKSLVDALNEVLTKAESSVKASPGWIAQRQAIKTKHGFDKPTAFYDAQLAPWVRLQALEMIRKFGGHIFGGSFVHRLMRGSNALSTHAWANAVDMDPTYNPMTRGKLVTTFPDWYIGAFENHGFEWGGRWERHDPMHFQLRA